MISGVNEVIYEDVQTQARIAELQSDVAGAQAQAPVTPAIGSGQFIVGTRASRATTVGQQLYAEYFETDTKLRYYWNGTNWLYSDGTGTGTDATRAGLAISANDDGVVWFTNDLRDWWRVVGGAWVRMTPRNNFNAAVAPGVNDDTTQGYAVNSIWSNTTAQDSYICLGAATGAAIWKKTTP